MDATSEATYLYAATYVALRIVLSLTCTLILTIKLHKYYWYNWQQKGLVNFWLPLKLNLVVIREGW